MSQRSIGKKHCQICMFACVFLAQDSACFASVSCMFFDLAGHIITNQPFDQ